MITKEYKEIIRAARAGGEVAKKYFGKSLKIEGKSMPADFRTKADLEAEKAVLRILKKEFCFRESRRWLNPRPTKVSRV